MIYELRVYEAVPGKLAALSVRFENHVAGLFVKHGMRVVGFWTTVVGEGSNEFTYLLAFENLADRETKWAAFQVDPEWHAARDESEKNGPLVARIRNQLLKPTAYSPRA